MKAIFFPSLIFILPMMGCMTPKGNYTEITESELMKKGAAIRICATFDFGTSGFLTINEGAVSYLHRLQTINVATYPGTYELKIEQRHGNFAHKLSTEVLNIETRLGEKSHVIYTTEILDAKEIFLGGTSTVNSFKYKPKLQLVDEAAFKTCCDDQRKYHNIDMYLSSK